MKWFLFPRLDECSPSMKESTKSQCPQEVHQKHRNYYSNKQVSLIKQRQMVYAVW